MNNDIPPGAGSQLPSPFAAENRELMNQIITEVVSQVKQTSDAIEPAERVEKERKKISFIAVSAVKMNYILGAALLVAVSLNCVSTWFAIHPLREYFASDNGRIFPLIPMSQPYRKPGDVIQFAKDTLTRSFTMDFENYRQDLEDNRARYTRTGFKSYIDALQNAGILEIVRQKRMNMSITAGTGVLVKDGIENGVYFWSVEVPIQIKLTGQTSELPTQRFLATVRVERIDTLDSIEGIGAAQLVTKPL
ncbi:MULTISPECIES: DotI/IcmL/TraM family protein [unclassified Pseudomonas]|uniref:DotI/IcmL/TraM family protein n=1 Tax=unclassified Pseudomonas TaxID=196821 RepID=UPI000C2FAD80|nr:MULTISPECIES: DotI/IcmL/TraM family protein [unclassified Pseudomonas]MCU1737528.1 DotI/IcmL family type IV secretion protein [Pseudomonas sp. 20S_6.2_Bac1]